MIGEFKEEMRMRYEIIDMGLLHYFLGMEIYQDEEGVFVSQKKYAKKILKKFKIFGCKLVTTPLVCNEKLMKEDGEKKIDETICRSLIVNLLLSHCTKTRYHVCCKFTIKIHEQFKSGILWCWKKSLEIHTRNNEVWDHIWKKS